MTSTFVFTRENPQSVSGHGAFAYLNCAILCISATVSLIALTRGACAMRREDMTSRASTVLLQSARRLAPIVIVSVLDIAAAACGTSRL
jgi:hypothetical protein